MSKVRWYVVIRSDWSNLFHANWKTVKPYVNKVSRVKYRGFDTEEQARNWWKTETPIIEKIKPVSDMFKYHVYTDGSYLSKTNSGGWAYVLIDPKNQQIIKIKSGKLPSQPKPTNNRAELLAILNATTDIESNLTIYSDSNYSIQAVTIWYKKWKLNGWMTSKNQPVENKDLIQKILKTIESRNISFQHVKAHNGDTFNELADQTAREAAMI